MITILLYLWSFFRRGKEKLSKSDALVQGIKEIWDDFHKSNNEQPGHIDYVTFHNAFVVPYLSGWKEREINALLNLKRTTSVNWVKFEEQIRSLLASSPEIENVREVLANVLQKHFLVDIKVEKEEKPKKEEKKETEKEKKTPEEKKPQPKPQPPAEEQKGKVDEHTVVEDREKEVIVLDDHVTIEDPKKEAVKVETKTTPEPIKESKPVVPKTNDVTPPKDDNITKTEEIKKKEMEASIEAHVADAIEMKRVILYHITVKTGDKFNAGTDANVFVCLMGDNSDTGKIVLRAQDCDRDKLFEKGAEDHFTIKALDVGEVKRIRIGHDNKDGFAGWFLDRVTVHAQDYQLLFKANRWLDEDEGDKKLEVELTPEKVVQAAPSRMYGIYVKTGDVRYGGTDANVYVTISGSNGTTGKITLKNSKSHKDPFDRDHVDHFIVQDKNVGDINKIRIGHDGKRSGAGWYLDHVIIEASGFDHKWRFNADRWLDKKEADGQLEVDLNAQKISL